jgi:uncharacterized protein (DUF697 family)
MSEFWDNHGGSIVSGGIGTIASGIEGLISGRSSRKQRKWAESMWNKQNAYNTPRMQMQRLRDAGLNPALMYGKGTTGNAEKPLAYQQMQTPSVGANINAGMVAGVQMDLVKSQKKLNDANAFAKTIEAYLKGGGSKETATNMFEKQMENLVEDTNLKAQQVINNKTLNKLNKEFLKLEKQGFHKGNMLATLMKSVYGLDLQTQEGRTTAQWIIGGLMGLKAFESLSQSFKNILSGFTRGKSDVITETFRSDGKWTETRQYKMK